MRLAKVAKGVMACMIIAATTMVLLVCAVKIFGHFIVPEWFIPQNRYHNPSLAVYKDVPYYTPEFVGEMLDIYGRKLVTLPGRESYVASDNYSGKYINVKEYLRVTTDQPDTYQARVCIFGGSTTFCAEAPDNMTIASHLQRILNEKSNIAYKVVNYGVPGISINLIASRIASEKINKGDIVIIYAGVNCMQEWIYIKLYANALKKGEVSDFLLKATAKMPSVFYPDLVAYLNCVGNNTRATSAGQEDTNAAMLELENTYVRGVKRAHDLVVSQGGKFINFIQPDLFTSQRETNWEEDLKKTVSYCFPSIENAHKLGRIALGRANQSLAESGISSHDISNIYHGSPMGSEFFIDLAHVNGLGNKIVAEAISSYVLGLPHR